MQENTKKEMKRTLLKKNARLENCTSTSQAIELNDSYIRLTPRSFMIVGKGDRIAYNTHAIEIEAQNGN